MILLVGPHGRSTCFFWAHISAIPLLKFFFSLSHFRHIISLSSLLLFLRSCRNLLLFSFPQVHLNNTHITNKLNFLQYSAKRLKTSSFGPLLFLNNKNKRLVLIFSPKNNSDMATETTWYNNHIYYHTTQQSELSWRMID